MYLDSSVMVKLFTREPESEFYGHLVDGQTLSTSVLAYTEVWSALLAKERGGDLTPAWRRRSWEAFDRNVTNDLIEMLPLSPAIFNRANRILEACHPRVPLRSLEALHLSSADQAQDWPLVTGDKRMRDAARLLGFPVTPLPD